MLTSMYVLLDGKLVAEDIVGGVVSHAATFTPVLSVAMKAFVAISCIMPVVNVTVTPSFAEMPIFGTFSSTCLSEAP